jgi:peroxiredoxin
MVCLNIAVVFGEGEAFVGKATPSFVAKDLDGNELDINSYKGKNTVLINFWGLRCGACIEEMPHLNKLYDDYKDDGLLIFGINADGIDADFLKSPRGMAKLPLELKYTIIEDPDMKLIDLYQMEAAPLNILIDKEGIVQYYHMGYEPGEEKELFDKVKSVIK